MTDGTMSTSPPPTPDAAAFGADVARDLQRVRAATAKYRDIEAAYADGYPSRMPPCLDNPPHGGMGLHYSNRKLLDDRLDLEHPENLIYAPTPEGKPRLVGVEYIVPYSAWDRPEPPRIFGRPLKRADGLQLWYLHVWTWEPNVNGLFADWNPAVKC
ncbi:MAG TPA: hypothetical protein VF212_07250 [Longimicrobiales bacterium]